MQLIVNAETSERVDTLQEVEEVRSAIISLLQDFDIDYVGVDFEVTSEGHLGVGFKVEL